MAIIDFNNNFIPVDAKTSKERAEEYYNKNKNSLRFNIGDNVKIDVPFNAPTSLRKILKDKAFEVIGVDFDYNFDDPLSYILDTGTDITLFKEKNLIKV